MNSLKLEFLDELDGVLDEAVAASLRVLVERIVRVFDKIEATGIQVIAAVNGYAMGGGFELALACDFRVLSTMGKVGLTGAKLGATPGAGGVQKLARHIRGGIDRIAGRRQDASARLDASQLFEASLIALDDSQERRGKRLKDRGLQETGGARRRRTHSFRTSFWGA